MNEAKTAKKMDMLELVMELEGGEVLITDDEDMKAVLDICDMFSCSQGFYGRLKAQITDFLEDPDHVDRYPAYM